jgi:hypothetical protein
MIIDQETDELRTVHVGECTENVLFNRVQAWYPDYCNLLLRSNVISLTLANPMLSLEIVVIQTRFRWI